MKNLMGFVGALAWVFAAVMPGAGAEPRLSYPVADTGQDRCYGERGEIEFPQPGQPFFGQDAQYAGAGPAYRDRGDGTVEDLVTGLIWQKTPDFVKRNQDDAETYAKELKLAGHEDWRLPAIGELFSIVDFRGNMRTRAPYIDTRYFDFQYPPFSVGESGPVGQRAMDAQYVSATRYVGTTMRGDTSAFGFNFADGRIKSYPVRAPRYVRCVRGSAYGINDFIDNGDGTIADRATGLIWTKADSARAMNWRDALAYAEGLKLAGREDWRLPSVKELQSIVDYTRAPDARVAAARAPAIDPIFEVTKTESWCWSGTTHLENRFAYYVCFGQGLSALPRDGKPMNAHGAGAVRSDPKSGDPALWSGGLGPQSDEVRILNFVRCVRGGRAELQTTSTLAVQTEPDFPAPRPGRNTLRPGAPSGERFIRRLDRDGDGKVSRAEFDGPPYDFGRLDRNGDGYLSADEAPGPPR